MPRGRPRKTDTETHISEHFKKVHEENEAIKHHYEAASEWYEECNGKLLFKIRKVNGNVITKYDYGDIKKNPHTKKLAEQVLKKG